MSTREDPSDLLAEFPSYVKRTEGRLLAVANRIVHDHDCAADRVSEAYLRLWQALREKPESIPSPPDVWLFRVTRNLCQDELRRRGRQAATGGDPDAVASDDPDPADQAAVNLDVPHLLQLATGACGERAVAIWEQMRGHDVAGVAVAEQYQISRRQAYHAAEKVERFLRRHRAS